MDNKEIIKRIKEQINKIQPFLASEGGMVEFVKFENGIAYVQLGGACSECTLIDVTLKDVIEEIIMGEVPEVKEVKRI